MLNINRLKLIKLKLLFLVNFLITMSSPLSYHSLDINNTTTTNNSSHDINSKQQNDKNGIENNSLINTVTIEPIPSRSASLNDLKADLT